MKKLTSYVLGMATVMVAVPIIESTTEIVCSWLEVFKTKPMKIILKANSEIEDLQAKLEPVNTNAIGFMRTDDYVDDDDFEEDKIKIGFR